ncbi:MAG: hypothetical protein WCD76_13010 [Pyrinomonadaceae bacterium]
MRFYKEIRLFALAFIILMLVGATRLVIRGQEEKNSQSGSKADITEEQVPVAIYDDVIARANSSAVNDENKQKTELRMLRNGRYDKSYTVEEFPPYITVTPRSANWVADVPSIPVTQCNVALIGEVSDARAFLSNDRTGIYSEFTITAEKILKSDVDINQGQSVIAERAGGSVRFPSGNIQRIYVFRGQRMPSLHNRYLFFLKRNETEETYTLLTGYAIQDGKISSLDNIQPYLSYTNSNEDYFLSLVKNLIAGAKANDATFVR